MERETYRVALCHPTGLAFVERLHQGILDWAREEGNWRITRLPEFSESSLSQLQHWPGEGGFVFINNPEQQRIVKGLRIPVVCLSSTIEAPGVDCATVDHFAAGRVAAEHLLERGFRHLAFYGTTDYYYSRERWLGFREVAEAHRIPSYSLRVPSLNSTNFCWQDEERELRRWLGELPVPLGVFGATDQRASMVVEAARDLGRRVPREIAVVGMDNDPVVCELCQPSLSSISRSDYEVGRRAAIRLDQLMKRIPSSPSSIRVPPDGVVQRKSTDIFAAADPLIAAALEEIMIRLDKPFSITEIAERVGLGRRRFESRFRETLKATPHFFISRLRVEKAKRLLLSQQSPKLSLTQIAAQCGFSSLHRFNEVFQRIDGISPARFREERAMKP